MNPGVWRINSILVGIAVGMALVLAGRGLDLLNIVRPSSDPSLSFSLGYCLLFCAIMVIICAGTGYLAARQSQELIRDRHDAASMALLAGVTAGLIWGTDRIILPIILLANHDNLSILDLIASLIFGSMFLFTIICWFGAIAIIGGGLFLYRKMKRDQGTC